MQIFVVRLNPDTRNGLPYSKYPTLKEYREIHESSPMDGFHEAVNFLPEEGVVRGYLPPKHLCSMRDGTPFILVTITAKTAKIGGDKVVGIQAGCRYEGDNSRAGGTAASRKLKLNWHYSCAESLSLVLSQQPADARKLVVAGGTWVRGPTYKINKSRLKPILRTIQNSLSTAAERRKFRLISRSLDTSTSNELPEISPVNFDLSVAEALEGDLSRVAGTKVPEQKEVRTFQYQRNPKVAAFALKKAKGDCGDCSKVAPFKSNRTGLPYLEVHHIVMLKDGGSDTIDNVIALCPNCHRKRHYG